MKQKIRLTIVILSLVMVGCAKRVNQESYDNMEWEYQQKVEELEAKVTELESDVASKQEYINVMNASIQEVSSDADRFDYENWQYVVPDIYNGIKELESNIQIEP